MRTLTDADLLGRLSALVGQERESVADVVEHLREVDRRDLAIDRGFTSTFAYCLQVLRYSESEAFLRIRAARASEKFPRLLADLREGRVHLDSIARLAPHLTLQNIGDVLERASGATKKEVLAIVAQLHPEPAPARDVVVPVAPAPAALPEPAESAVPLVIAPPQHRFHFTADNDFLELVEKLRGLLRHKYPDGRLESIFKEAALALVDRIDPARPRRPSGEAKPQRKRSRAVPEPVRRAVWDRDGGRCAYVAEDGRRCESRDALEYDHIVPWARGGASDSAANIRLLCRPHNQWLGRKAFGPYARRRP